MLHSFDMFIGLHCFQKWYTGTETVIREKILNFMIKADMAETFSVVIWLTNTMLALMLFSIPAFMIAEEVIQKRIFSYSITVLG